MSTREDMKRFYGMNLDFGAIGLQKPDRDMVYFCTPEGAEPAGSLGVDGIHFILLPGDERVFCVDPSMMSHAYVLPVAEDFRTFLSYLLSCKDANVLSQISWMSREQYRDLLNEDENARYPGWEEAAAKKREAVSEMEKEFHLTPQDPFDAVKILQAAFDPSPICWSDEYYDVLGLEREE